jgi:hypothetical protein
MDKMQFRVKRKNHGKNITEKIMPSESLSLTRSTKYPPSDSLPNFFAISPSNQSSRMVMTKKTADNRYNGGPEYRNRAVSMEVITDNPETAFGFTLGKGKAKPILSTLFLKPFTKPSFVSSARTTPPILR